MFHVLELQLLLVVAFASYDYHAVATAVAPTAVGAAQTAAAYGCCSFVSTTAVVDTAVGNNSCFTMVMTNSFWAQQQTNNCHMDMSEIKSKKWYMCWKMECADQIICCWCSWLQKHVAIVLFAAKTCCCCCCCCCCLL